MKLGGVAAVGGSLLGYAGATAINDQQKHRDYVDSHYLSKPEVFVSSPRQEAVTRASRRASVAGSRRGSEAAARSPARRMERRGSARLGAERRDSERPGTERREGQRHLLPVKAERLTAQQP
jgi:hypothetical protein